MSTATKTTALEEIQAAARDNGWTVTDLGEVTFRTQGSFGRDGVTHVNRGIEISWEGDSRFLVFFKPTGSFHFAVPSRRTWADVRALAEQRADERVRWYHDSNDAVAEACAHHGVEVGVPFSKRKGMVEYVNRYGSITHQITDEGKNYLVVLPYSAEHIARVREQSLAEETYRYLDNYRRTKTELLKSLANSPAKQAERERQQDIERQARNLAEAEANASAARSNLVLAQATLYRRLLAEGMDEGQATTVVTIVQQDDAADLVRAAQAARQAETRLASTIEWGKRMEEGQEA